MSHHLTPPADAPTLHVDLQESARAYELDRAHVFHSWSAQAALDPMVLAGAQGSWVWDGDGNRLLDFSSQLVFTNIGHQHPVVVQAIKDQADRLLTTAPQHAVGVRSEAARLVLEHLPGDRLTKVFFTNGGTEAVENAVRMARLHTGKHKVLSAYRSYHGHTATSMALTGEPRRWATDLGTAGVSRFFGPYLYRSPFNATTEAEECERALAHLDQVIRLEGPGTLAAVVLESVVGSAGVLPPPPGYLAGVRELCTEHGLLLVLDEVMAGFGRTGRWFGYQHDGQDGLAADPDLVTFAKGVNSGLRADGRGGDQRRRRGHLRQPSVPRRADLLRPPAGRGRRRRDDRRDGARGRRRQRRPDRHRRARPGSARPRRAARGGRRGAGVGRVLGRRAGGRPRHPRAGGAVRRRGSGEQADHRPDGRVPAPRAAALPRAATGCTSCRRARSAPTRRATASACWARRWARSSAEPHPLVRIDEFSASDTRAAANASIGASAPLGSGP